MCQSGTQKILAGRLEGAVKSCEECECGFAQDDRRGLSGDLCVDFNSLNGGGHCVLERRDLWGYVNICLMDILELRNDSQFIVIGGELGSIGVPPMTNVSEKTRRARHYVYCLYHVIMIHSAGIITNHGNPQR